MVALPSLPMIALSRLETLSMGGVQIAIENCPARADQLAQMRIVHDKLVSSGRLFVHRMYVLDPS